MGGHQKTKGQLSGKKNLCFSKPNVWLVGDPLLSNERSEKPKISISFFLIVEKPDVAGNLVIIGKRAQSLKNSI
jgi:hypothetical protein